MAKVFPDGWRELTATGAAGRERQTLARLTAGLDDDYTVYHGVHWTHVERGSDAIHSRASSLPQLRLTRIHSRASSLPQPGIDPARIVDAAKKDLP